MILAVVVLSIVIFIATPSFIQGVSIPEDLCHEEVDLAKRIGSSHTDLMALAVCLHQHGHPDTARVYHHIRESTPDYSYVLVNLGVLALKTGDIQTARKYLETYIEEVGGIFGDQIPTDRLAIQRGSPCRPNAQGKIDCVNALNNLAALELTDNKNSSAATFYLSRAIEIGDDYMLVDAYANLGGHLSKTGDHEGASDAFIRGVWVNLKAGNMDAVAGLLVRRAFLVPTVASSLEETEKSRIGFTKMINDITKLATSGGSSWLGSDESDLFRVSRDISTIEQIRQLPKLEGVLDSWTSNVQVPHFYVHYYGWHDLPLNIAVADMFSLLCPPSLFEVANHLVSGENNAISSSNGQKKRVGFVSSLIGGDEPHGLLVLDIIRSLKGTGLFEFYVVSAGSKPLSQEFYEHSNGVYSIGFDEFQARAVLKSLELDCLIYLESMNEAMVHLLGYQRYAREQILVMGSPVTSGIPTFDYFVSGDLLEHPFRTQLKEDHYSEQVVLFDGQAISFPQEQVHLRQDSALAAGDAASMSNMTALERMNFLREQDAHIYTCYQSIQKIQPSFDHVLVDILIADPKANIVLQASRNALLTDTLNRRLQHVLKDRFCGDSLVECNSCVKAHARIHFMPRVKSDQVIDLMQKSDVILHPFPFGGSKTASDAINAGVPLVTFPQRYLRGRMASVFIKNMDLGAVDPDAASCCIASSVSDYVTKAVRLASDKEYRSMVANATKKRGDRIFNDKMVAFEWGKLLTRALGIRINDEDLKTHIDFVPEERHQESWISKAVEDEQKRWQKSAALSGMLGVH